MDAITEADVVIVGAGWGGTAAAVSASKAGASVLLLERADMLLGTGLVGGIMRNNGRYTAAEEMIALGGGDLFEICDRNTRHRNIDFPGHKHASLYDIGTIHGEVLGFLEKKNIDIIFNARVIKAEVQDGRIISVKDQKGRQFKGSVFIDATGTAGPMDNCVRYGNGCAACIMRCPSFGGRVSLTALAGIKEYVGKRADGASGSMSGSCKLYKESLSQEIQEKLNRDGVAVIPVPVELVEDHLSIKACQQYALKEFKDNLVLLDTGHAKLMAPYYSLERLRKIPGFENARYEDPYAGGKGNSIRHLAMAPRNDAMKVTGVKNLFCCGEKSGLMVGHTEAIVTGTLAGYNSVRLLRGREAIRLPRTLAVGDIIAHTGELVQAGEGVIRKFTFSGSIYFERMKDLGLYSTDVQEIQNRVEKSGLKDTFALLVETEKLKI